MWGQIRNWFTLSNPDPPDAGDECFCDHVQFRHTKGIGKCSKCKCLTFRHKGGRGVLDEPGPEPKVPEPEPEPELTLV